jgi:hypothetical protein
MITGVWYGPIMCRVEAATRVYPGGEDDGIDRGKWVYTLTSMEWGTPDSSDPPVTVISYPFPKTSAQTNPGFSTVSAFNLWELSNDDVTQYGITVSSLPGEFELQPVPIGAFVMAWNTTSKPDPQGYVLTLFTYPNQFNGTC